MNKKDILKKDRKERSKKIGEVVGISGEKTIKVRVSRRLPDSLIKKIITLSTSYLVHIDSTEKVKKGNIVEITETRPISKNKKWRFNKIIS